MAIRTKFYQGVPHQDTEHRIFYSGHLLPGRDGDGSVSSFSIKDVCDKIIHADAVNKNLETGVDKPVLVLKGRKGKEEWRFEFSVSLFAEGVLNWVDALEKNRVNADDSAATGR